MADDVATLRAELDLLAQAFGTLVLALDNHDVIDAVVLKDVLTQTEEAAGPSLLLRASRMRRMLRFHLDPHGDHSWPEKT